MGERERKKRSEKQMSKRQRFLQLNKRQKPVYKRMFLARAPGVDEIPWSGHLLGCLLYSKKRSMKEGSGSQFKRMKQDQLDKLAHGEEFLVKLVERGELKKTRTAHVIESCRVKGVNGHYECDLKKDEIELSDKVKNELKVRLELASLEDEIKSMTNMISKL